MIRKYLDFEKTSDGKWYIVLPDWTGDKDDLEMVEGADRILDYLDYRKNNKISIEVTDDGWAEIRIDLKVIGSEEIGGAFYSAHSERTGLIPSEIWLCDVTKHVLGEFPKVLYITPINY